MNSKLLPISVSVSQQSMDRWSFAPQDAVTVQPELAQDVSLNMLMTQMPHFAIIALQDAQNAVLLTRLAAVDVWMAPICQELSVFLVTLLVLLVKAQLTAVLRAFQGLISIILHLRANLAPEIVSTAPVQPLATLVERDSSRLATEHAEDALFLAPIALQLIS